MAIWAMALWRGLRSLDKVTLTGHWRSELLRYGGNFFGMAVSNYVPWTRTVSGRFQDFQGPFF